MSWWSWKRDSIRRRDPRKDPKAGDLVRANGRRLRVVLAEPGRVQVRDEGPVPFGQPAPEGAPPHEWTDMEWMERVRDAEILRATEDPEPVPELPFDPTETLLAREDPIQLRRAWADLEKALAEKTFTEFKRAEELVAYCHYRFRRPASVLWYFTMHYRDRVGVLELRHLAEKRQLESDQRRKELAEKGLDPGPVSPAEVKAAWEKMKDGCETGGRGKRNPRQNSRRPAPAKAVPAGPVSEEFSDVVSALTNLGYRKRESEQAAHMTFHADRDFQDNLRDALAKLSPLVAS